MIRSFVVGMMLVAFSFPPYAYAGCGFGHRRNVFHKAIVVKEVFYPVYYQVGAGLREQAIADEAARKALEANNAQWEQRISQLLRFRGTATLQFEGEAEGSAEAGGGVDTPPPPEPAPGGGGAPADVLGIFASKCAACHKPGGQGFQASGLDLTLPVTDPAIAATIFARTFSQTPGKRMPPNGNISDEEIQSIFQWQDSF